MEEIGVASFFRVGWINKHPATRRAEVQKEFMPEFNPLVPTHSQLK